MQKKTKMLILAACAVLALSLMALSFAAWSTDVSLQGTVSANGRWDVKVTDAALEVSNAGAAMQDMVQETSLNSHLEGIDYFTSSISSKLAMESKVAELREAGATILASNYDVRKFNAYVNYAGPEGTVKETVGYFDVAADARAAASARAAELRENGTTVYSSGNGTVWTYTIDYAATVAAASVNGAIFSDTAVDYADVVFSLPAAWANYQVTVTNNGTVDADLAEYSFAFTDLPEEIFETDVPDLTDCVLAPGEACTVNFVVKVKDTDADLVCEAASFRVGLSYGPEAVNAAPEAGHDH